MLLFLFVVTLSFILTSVNVGGRIPLRKISIKQLNITIWKKIYAQADTPPN